MKIRHALAGITIGVSVIAVVPHLASAQTPPCAITSATVNAATATFTVGSAECTGTVGPISFSTYALPNGKVLPYNKQVAIAHHPSNGASYGAGTYTLTLTLDGAKCWQSDLYYGPTVLTPPHPHTIAVDYHQCAEVPTTTTIQATGVPPVPSSTTTTLEPALPTTPTTAPEIPCVLGPDGHYNFAGTNNPCEGPATTTTIALLTPPEAPTTTVSTPPSGGLPATGFSAMQRLGLAMIVFGCGWGLIRLARRPRTS
jgi:hypothetical protein